MLFLWIFSFFILFSMLNISANELRNEPVVEVVDDEFLKVFSSKIIYTMDGKRKGGAGKICVIGGSAEYSGAPYFSAISSLKAGADLVFVFTTKAASDIIKSYSPDLIVYPLLSRNHLNEIESLLVKMDVVIIGPGLGKEDTTISLINDIIKYCKDKKKPLVIDADGLYAISENISVLKFYPSPGVILTPNHHEADRFKITFSDSENWQTYWGSNVTVLIKGKHDSYFTSNPNHTWLLNDGGSSRRAAGQGDILAGILGTFYNWAIKADVIDTKNDVDLHYFKSVATYAAAKFTRTCNAKAFEKHGRSMVASDMINEFSSTFKQLGL